jgi:hypothetical protein
MTAGRRRPVLLVWLAAQLAVVSYLFWLSEIKGVGDHHLGMLFVPTFGVLLFPGVQVVFAVLAVCFWVARGLGLEPALLPDRIATPVGVLVWGVSAWATHEFWTWVLRGGQSLVHGKRGAQGPL